MKVEFDPSIPEEQEAVLRLLGASETQKAETIVKSEPAVIEESLQEDEAPVTMPPQSELDSTGKPWDDRINTANKARTQKGIFKRRPGISDELYNSVLAQLPTSTMPGPPTSEQMQVAAGVAPPPPTTTEEPKAMTLVEFFNEVTAKGVPMEKVNTVLGKYGYTMDTLTAIAANDPVNMMKFCADVFEA